LNPSRTSFIDVARNLGVDIEVSDITDVSGEPVGTIMVRGGVSKANENGNKIGGGIIANLIDEIPILAILGTQLEGGIEVRNASELRAKESDRIAAVVKNLDKMGADVEEFPDGFRVGRSHLKGAEVDSFGDHRIAMAFGIASLFADGETRIIDMECADVSFPGFFEELQRISQ
jgi:3-phosphoshikimate 1-carboxyvinyltransferase